ncbi:MAG TPA: hypothetical protein ENH28_05490 [Euryarchaeota archaeon]|nr:hypothetical protein BMS3Bbin15_00169 [archaeon BMS3Bbin15]HDL15584.1 hypothetical protein [Euryarchaeota archaeon]
MTNKQIYAPLSEDGLLKSLGPFRFFITDKSITGTNRGDEKIYRPLVIGETLVCGETIIIKKKSK